MYAIVVVIQSMHSPHESHMEVVYSDADCWNWKLTVMLIGLHQLLIEGLLLDIVPGEVKSNQQ